LNSRGRSPRWLPGEAGSERSTFSDDAVDAWLKQVALVVGVLAALALGGFGACSRQARPMGLEVTSGPSNR